jgi:hypothetical protein
MSRFIGSVLIFFGLARGHGHLTECRNQTCGQGGVEQQEAISWHIQSNTNETGMKLLSEAFMKEFYTLKKFPFLPGRTQCSSGPNLCAEYYAYVRSLETPNETWGADAVHFRRLGGSRLGSPSDGTQRASFFPNAYIDEAWNWVNAFGHRILNGTPGVALGWTAARVVYVSQVGHS